MIYTQHDLVKNLQNALALNDSQTVYDIIISEVGNLLNTNKPALIQAIQQAGGKIENDADNLKVAEAVAEALVKNKKSAIKLIALAIIGEKSKYMGADIATAIVQAVDGVATAAGQIASAKINADATKRAAAAQITAARLGITNSIMQAQGAQNQAAIQARMAREQGNAGLGSTKYMVIGLVAVVVVSVVGLIIYKKSNAGAVAAAAPAK